jgi:hypothetical protein
MSLTFNVEPAVNFCLLSLLHIVEDLAAVVAGVLESALAYLEHHLALRIRPGHLISVVCQLNRHN